MQPKVPIGKCMTGTAFEIALETLRLFQRFKRNVGFQLPGDKLGSVATASGVMLGHALLEI
jgi:hypothetical protein